VGASYDALARSSGGNRREVGHNLLMGSIHAIGVRLIDRFPAKFFRGHDR